MVQDFGLLHRIQMHGKVDGDGEEYQFQLDIAMGFDAV